MVRYGKARESDITSAQGQDSLHIYHIRNPFEQGGESIYGIEVFAASLCSIFHLAVKRKEISVSQEEKIFRNGSRPSGVLAM